MSNHRWKSDEDIIFCFFYYKKKIHENGVDKRTKSFCIRLAFSNWGTQSVCLCQLHLYNYSWALKIYLKHVSVTETINLIRNSLGTFCYHHLFCTRGHGGPGAFLSYLKAGCSLSKSAVGCRATIDEQAFTLPLTPMHNLGITVPPSLQIRFRNVRLIFTHYVVWSQSDTTLDTSVGCKQVFQRLYSINLWEREKMLTN